MTTIKINNDQNEIYNEVGLQLIGSNAPNQHGLNPKELLEASLGLCISITIRNLLERDEIDIDPTEIEVDVIASKEPGVKSRFTHFHVQLKLPAILDLDYKSKLITQVERICTISNTLRHAPVIEAVEV
ncbi:putative OsmC-like protein [Paenibacillus turicensis]|uniref:OsmC-like protein n=1 Tax=Paenibacillus turicensis TaxID=160487 RepID=A0ABS4FX76_9BACL|nr:OsmC family protein [Paenibacillus turicensis]MBP1907177.1 putative OsmC-like protein [Paenibacillus turicensis]